jgi:hypothetical protein
MTWQALQHVEVKGERRLVNVYHCELCDKLSAAALPSPPKKRGASNALHR